jgi:hypothetical protein
MSLVYGWPVDEFGDGSVTLRQHGVERGSKDVFPVLLLIGRAQKGAPSTCSASSGCRNGPWRSVGCEGTRRTSGRGGSSSRRCHSGRARRERALRSRAAPTRRPTKPGPVSSRRPTAARCSSTTCARISRRASAPRPSTCRRCADASRIWARSFTTSSRRPARARRPSSSRRRSTRSVIAPGRATCSELQKVINEAMAVAEAAACLRLTHLPEVVTAVMEPSVSPSAAPAARRASPTGGARSAPQAARRQRRPGRPRARSPVGGRVAMDRQVGIDPVRYRK